MSTPFPPIGNPPAPGPPRIQPYHLLQTKQYAVEQERKRHAEALYEVGEWTVFFLLWNTLDFERDLVERCSRCYGTFSARADRIAAVYNQPVNNKCPVCFGTTFEGGYRARIVRPAIFADTDQDQRLDRRGEVHPATVSIETTWDFRIRTGDFAVRADNSRWRLRVPSRTTVRTGFGFPGQTEAAVTYARITGEREETDTVAYLLPPVDGETVENVLRQPARSPLDFTVFEQVRGPLLPDEYLET